jgi:hypothetical protein
MKPVHLYMFAVMHVQACELRHTLEASYAPWLKWQCMLHVVRHCIRNAVMSGLLQQHAS